MKWLLLPPLLYVLLWVILALRARSKPGLKVWHRANLRELTAADYPLGMTFEELREKEEEVFARLEIEVYDRVLEEDRLAYNRYFSGSNVNPDRAREIHDFPLDYNRSYEVLPAGEARGAVLLVHGLTDSPYSMRAIADIFRDRGLYALVLRLPGQGTVPAALTRAKRGEWEAAVRWGAHHVRARAGSDPVYLAGYSSGGGLLVSHCLELLETGRHDEQPERIFTFSPAIGIHPLAAVSDWHKLYSYLPGLERYRWMEIEPEYDPFKYNSFPKNAADQAHLFTKELKSRVRRLKGRLSGLPPILTFQSVIDTSVRVEDLVDDLYARLEAGRSELVLFDINRLENLDDFIRDEIKEIFTHLDLDTLEPTGYRLTLVTNESGDTAEVVAKSKAPGARSFEPSQPLGLSWRANIYSLSHVAVPFREDDPVYGASHDEEALSLGALAPRGENKVLSLSLDALMRLRHNIFFEYMRRRIEEML